MGGRQDTVTPAKRLKTFLKINDESPTRLMPFGRADLGFAHSAEAIGGSEAQRLGGSVWEAPGRLLGRLLGGFREAPGRKAMSK